jgi:hypothetical protein
MKYFKFIISFLCLAPWDYSQAQSILFNNFGSPQAIQNASLPLTISTPGRWIVIEPLNYTAAGTTPAITIATSNVALDFLNFGLTQANTISSITGIQIQSGLNDIDILNASINNFSQTAIGINTGCTNLNISNATIIGCGNRAIEAIGSIASPIQQFNINGCTVIGSCTTAAADNVFTFSNCSDFSVNNCILSSNGSAVITGTCVGIKLTNCARHISSNNVIENFSGQFDVRGYSCNKAETCQFNNCTVANLVASGGGSTCQGFTLESNTVSLNPSSTGNVFQQCMVNQITGTNIVDGFFTGSGSNDNLYMQCAAQGLRGLNVTAIVHGYRTINNSRISYLGCLALSCTAANSTVAAPLYGAYGFKIDFGAKVSMRNCAATDINAAPTGRSVGFFWLGSTSCGAVENYAERNTIGFDANGAVFAGVNGNGWILNVSQKNVNAAYSSAWPVGATNTVASNNLVGITAPSTNIGLT